MIALAAALVMSGPAKLVVGYVPNWIDLAAFAKEIDYAKVTHLNVAFENPTDDAGTMSFDPDDEVLIKAAHAKGVKVLVSIGGGSAASDEKMQKRYFALTADDKRKAFVDKLTSYVGEHGFDGLDVDIEGPSIGKDYGPFIADLATALKAKGKLLTAALSQGYGGDQVPSESLKLFDFVNVMAYDATGPWNPDRHGQHSSMEHAKSTTTYWLGRGLAKDKAVLGVPFYGYGFGKAFRDDGYSYSEILALHPTAATQDQVGETIWHNSVPTIKAKAKWVADEGLAGVMIWSLDQDVKGDNSLLAALNAGLGR
ncbi:MAG TPA: glycosyl hydrolase family 18 protein [Fimbriimonas sp.]|nr:glycosyl hydrolase family 18 protein [Fimbriimonas sp.]